MDRNKIREYTKVLCNILGGPVWLPALFFVQLVAQKCGTESLLLFIPSRVLRAHGTTFTLLVAENGSLHIKQAQHSTQRFCVKRCTNDGHLLIVCPGSCQFISVLGHDIQTPAWLRLSQKS